jgi:hypothetical protein
MNTVSLVPATLARFSYWEIEVDGVPLPQHFTGGRGAHAAQISPLGWTSSSAQSRVAAVEALLSGHSSSLESGRVPVLVCAECGDVGCGAVAVRIAPVGDRVRWTDWAYENGYEPAASLEWRLRPGDFVFDRRAYENAIKAATSDPR